MRFLIVGAGAMGLGHGWLLSKQHDVIFLVRPGRADFYRQEFDLRINDLRPGQTMGCHHFRPVVTETVSGNPDAVLVMVDRLHLAEALPRLVPLASHCPIVFMLNHWDLARQVNRFLAPTDYLIGFPSQLGGGRLGHLLTLTVFGSGTILQAPQGDRTAMIRGLTRAFEVSGLRVHHQRRILDWLRVHCLQQALTAAPILEAGGFVALTEDRRALDRLVRAFREGLAVCRAAGVPTWRVWPGPLFLLPTPIVVRVLQGMFRRPEVAAMVTGHMRHGLPEWVQGCRDIHRAGRRAGIRTPELDHQMEVLTASGWPGPRISTRPAVPASGS